MTKLKFDALAPLFLSWLGLFGILISWAFTQKTLQNPLASLVVAALIAVGIAYFMAESQKIAPFFAAIKTHDHSGFGIAGDFFYFLSVVTALFITTLTLMNRQIQGLNYLIIAGMYVILCLAGISLAWLNQLKKE